MKNLLAYVIQDLLCAAVVSVIFVALVATAGYVVGVSPQGLPTFSLYGMFGVSLVAGFHLWNCTDFRAGRVKKTTTGA